MSEEYKQIGDPERADHPVLAASSQLDTHLGADVVIQRKINYDAIDTRRTDIYERAREMYTRARTRRQSKAISIL